MERIDNIKKEITDKFIAQPEIIEAYGLDTEKTFEEQFSKASFESIMFYDDAYRALVVEQLFQYNIDLIDNKIRNQAVHTIGWYRTTALAFQYGKAFRDDLTEYDNSDMTDEEIEAQKIITKCAVTKADTDKPTLIIKVHKANGKLNDEEKTAFITYMNAKADAGVHTSIVSEDADRLILFMTIRYDAMVMDATGYRIMDNSNPVADTITEHLNNLQFNGTFYPTMLEADLMKQTGIRVATIRMAQAGVKGQTPVEFVDAYTPYSGALNLDIETDLYVTYERF